MYYPPQGVSEAEMALRRQIDELHLQHPFMRARQLVRQLRRLGFEVGRLPMRTLMLRMGLRPCLAACPQAHGCAAPVPLS